MKFLNNLDLQSNELQNAVIQNYAGNPDGTLTGTEGQIVYSTTVDAIFINTDSSTAWDRLATGSSAVASVTATNASIVVAGTATNPTIGHGNTSSVSDLSATARTYVDGITFDTYGHVTAISTSAETVTNSNTTYGISAVDDGADAIIRLTDSGAGTDDVKLVAGSNVTITPSGDDITIAAANDNDNDFVDGATFNSSNGELTLSVSTQSDVVVDLDGRYITSQSNDFGTIAVSGQTSVDASSAGDTVTFAGGGGMTITTGTDLVTFTSANDNDIDYVSGGSFNSTNGELTLTGTGNAGAVVDLDGRYLTSFTEADTLDSVTGRGATTTNAVTTGNLTVNGDLTVSGAHTVTLAEEVKVEDSIFVLNSNEAGTPSEDAGLVIERGTATNVAMLWDESADNFAFVNSNEDGTTTGNVTIASYAPVKTGDLSVAGRALVSTVDAKGTAASVFLTTGTAGVIESRTAAQVRSDIGAGTGNGAMDDFVITDGTTSTTIDDGGTVTLQGTGLVSVANVGGTFTVSTTANNYAHPTQTAINASGSGATVVDGVTVNTLGHTTAVSTRALTLANLGYTGATDANNYVLPTATASVTGGVELATTTEANTGSDTTRAVTAAGLTSFYNGRRFKGSIGDGSATSIAVTHNLGTTDVIVQLFDVSSGDTVYADVVRTSATVVTIDFGAAPASNDVRVLIIEL